MALWIVLTVLTSLVAVAVAIPIIRRFEAPKSDQDRILQVSRDQLAEIDADLARGTLAERDAAEARSEIERRVLTAARIAQAPLNPATASGKVWALAGLAGGIVIGATGLYAVIGRPDLPSRPAVQAVATAPAAAAMGDSDTTAAATPAAPAAPGTGSVEEMIAKLVARLADKPDDAEGWRMLGWSYFKTERYAEASEAYGKAVKLDGSNADVWSSYGETLVRTARGMVTDEAVAAFDAALKLNPQDPRARFFKGMALEQAGDAPAAIEAWLALAASAPAGADWLPGVVTRIDELAAATNFDLGGRLDAFRAAAARLPATGGLETTSGPAAMGVPAESPASDPAQPGPTAAQVAAAGDMTPEARQAMILGMVNQLADRLKANPDDPEGWAKLIRARMVLHDAEGAAAALTDAQAALAASPEKLAVITEAAGAAGLPTN